MNDELDKYIQGRIDALLERAEAEKNRAYVVFHRTRGDWERHLGAVALSPEAAGRALGRLVNEEHPGEELELVVISDNAIVYEQVPIPEGQVWVTRNGSMLWTRQIVAEVEVYEVSE